MPNNDNGSLYDRSFWHRLNQMYAEMGATAVLPEDWARAEAEDNAMCAELPYDGDRVARRLAGHMVANHLAAWEVGRRVPYEGWCSDSDATLYVLTYNSNATPVALRDIGQLRDFETDFMHEGGYRRCNALVSAKCKLKTEGWNTEYPVEMLAIKRGEHICAFIACHVCLLHISSGKGVDHPDYIGPTEDWFDDRQAADHGWTLR